LRKPLLLRILFGLVVGLLMAIPFSELAFRWQGNTTSRPPKTVVLEIPPGTADEVGQGKTVIPESLTFVAGDVLLVKNRDSVLHTLGPLVIPPGSSAFLPLNNVGNLSFICSFEPTKYLGLDIFEPLTLSTRLQGIVISGVPMGVLITLYSLVLRPLKKKTPPSLVPEK
jgi:hypothetical protein